MSHSLKPSRIYREWRRVRLFLSLVWRQCEPPGSVPEPYRSHYRITVRLAWDVATEVCQLRRRALPWREPEKRK